MHLRVLYIIQLILYCALEFNATCTIASYNTDDADRKACLDHVWDLYEGFHIELDSLVEEEDEGEEEENSEEP